MREFFFTLLIGIAAGILDVLPMIKMKLDKYSIAIDGSHGCYVDNIGYGH